MYSNFPNQINGMQSWSVSGSGTVTPFSESYQSNFPKYSGYNLLPDTVSKSAGFTLNINGISNCQAGSYLTINTSGAGVYRSLTSNTMSIAFTSSDLANLNPNQTLFIGVNLANSFSKEINGLNRGFSNIVYFTKHAYLKP